MCARRRSRAASAGDRGAPRLRRGRELQPCVQALDRFRARKLSAATALTWRTDSGTMPALDKPANPLDALVPPRGAQRVASERGWIAYWEMGPQICLTKAHGYMTRDMG